MRTGAPQSFISLISRMPAEIFLAGWLRSLKVDISTDSEICNILCWPRMKELIRANETGEIGICAISLWEVAKAVALNRLTFSISVED